MVEILEGAADAADSVLTSVAESAISSSGMPFSLPGLDLQIVVFVCCLFNLCLRSTGGGDVLAKLFLERSSSLTFSLQICQKWRKTTLKMKTASNRPA